MSHPSSTTNATVTNNQFTYPVLAHAGELHGRPAQPEAAPPPDTLELEDKDSTLESEGAQTGTAIPIELEVSPTSLPPIVAMPAGLGESLFTILVALPWLLMALRTQLHTQKNRS